MAEDEGVGSRGFSGRKERAQAIELLGSDWVANHLLDCVAVFSQVNTEKTVGALLTHDIDGIDRASKAIRVVLDDISRLEDSLNGAGFDIELVVAETVFSRWPSYQYATIPATCKCNSWALSRYLSSGEKFQSVTAP